MLKKVWALRDTLIGRVVHRYFDHRVGKHGASLAYYLLFALFPMMIFISNVLGQLDLDVHSIALWMSDFLPDDLVSLFESYLVSVSEDSSGTMLSFSLLFTLYFPFRATSSLMQDVRRAYGLSGNSSRPVIFALRQIIFTVVLFLGIALSLLLSTFGKRVLIYLFGLMRITLPSDAVNLWNYLRFLLIAIFMFAAIATLYSIAQDQRQPWRAIIPGAALTLLAWLAVSIAFSFYVENFAKYSVIYGALGTVIVLMLWLYMVSVIMILGAEFNQVIKESNNEKHNT